MATTKKSRQTHKHWPEDHPRYASAPWCDLPTKKACDERWTQYQHGHLGAPCVKVAGPPKSKKAKSEEVLTCSLIRPPGEGVSIEAYLRDRTAP